MEMADIQEKMFPSLIQSFNKGTVAQKNLKYLKEEKKNLFILEKLYIKTRGQKCSFKKKQIDSPRIKHLLNKAHFSRQLLRSFVIIFGVSIFISSDI